MGPEYTTCVEPKDYRPLEPAYFVVLGAVLAVGGFAAFVTGGLAGVVAAAAAFEALRYVLNWMVHGKLICLHRAPGAADCLCGGPGGAMVCALGEIADTEEVGQDKNPIADVDDDYAINLALLPFDMAVFARKGFVDPDDDAFDPYRQSLVAIATAPGQVQGDLLTRQPDARGEPEEFGYLRTMVMLRSGKYLPWTEVVGRDSGTPTQAPDENERWLDYLVKNAAERPEKFSVPVLHCEFEGSRARDMLAALEGFPFGTSFCKKNWLTKFVCKVLAAALAPVTLAALALAWRGNTEGSTDPALVDGGTIGPGNRVIVRGSWRFDAAHNGYNEIHAVRIVQRVERVPAEPKAFAAFLHTWCERLAETPLSDGMPKVPGGQATTRPQDIPAAGVTQTAQGRPENQWVMHPAVDGCRPTQEPPIIR